MSHGRERAKIPAPTLNPETAPFWEAAAKGKLLVKTLHRLRRARTTTRARSARSAAATAPSGRTPRAAASSTPTA